MKIINNTKTRRIITWVIATFFVVTIVVTTIQGNSNTHKLANQGVLANAYVMDITTTVRGDFAIDYRFIVNGKSFEDQHSYSELLMRYQNNFLNRTFPVIYLPQNPSINYLLVTPQSFKEYNKDFPDSLQWIMQYMRK
ncbi:MAG TPA: hypothetical protein VIJ75_02620 [Hanamia sp.]